MYFQLEGLRGDRVALASVRGGLHHPRDPTLVIVTAVAVLSITVAMGVALNIRDTRRHVFKNE